MDIKKVIMKDKFKQQDLVELEPNKTIAVVCDSYSSLDSAVMMSVLTRKRKPREDVEKYKTSREDLILYITAIPKQ